MTSTIQLRESAPRTFSINDETIERFLVDDLSQAERDVVRRAIDDDAALRAYVNEREAERRAFVFDAPRLALPDAKPRGARALSLRVTAFAGAFAMACALVFVIVRDDAVEQDGVRMRGGALPVDVVVRRDGRVFELAPGVPLRPGDALRVEVTSTQAGFVSAVLVDARGAALVYDAVPISRGVTVLPDSLILDDVSGAETLHVVLSVRRPSTRTAIVEAVLRDADRAGDARAAVSWHKEPRP